MTQEDLNSKLIQRAEFVAQREELDQMFDKGKTAFGKDFELYMRIGDGTGQETSRCLSRELDFVKEISFYIDILGQMR